MSNSVANSRSQVVVGALRALWHLLAVLTVTTWGFMSWTLPMPGIAFGLGALIFSVLLWALFLSPKPVLTADRFAQSMIELLLLASAVAAAIELGIPWPAAAAYGLIGAVLGFIVGFSAQKS